MNSLTEALRSRRDVSCMFLALILLLSAVIFKPTIYLKQYVRSYFFVVDISQSMNVEDLVLNGKSISRLEYTRDLLRRIISGLPCGTNVSIGLFAGSSVAAYYHPLEVCTHYNAINDTVAHIDWRSEWSANSRLRESLSSLATVVRSFPGYTQPIFFTDGEEAPKLHPFNTKELKGFQSGGGWLFVGIGALDGAPIPKYTDDNQKIGFWSNESFAIQPGISQISEGNLGARDTSVATAAYDRYISKMDEQYLQSLVKEIDAQYVRGDHAAKVLSAMKSYETPKSIDAPFDLSHILATIAGLLMIYMHLPVRSIKSYFKST